MSRRSVMVVFWVYEKFWEGYLILGKYQEFSKNVELFTFENWAWGPCVSVTLTKSGNCVIVWKVFRKFCVLSSLRLAVARFCAWRVILLVVVERKKSRIFKNYWCKNIGLIAWHDYGNRLLKSWDFVIRIWTAWILMLAKDLALNTFPWIWFFILHSVLFWVNIVFIFIWFLEENDIFVKNAVGKLGSHVYFLAIWN